MPNVDEGNKPDAVIQEESWICFRLQAEGHTLDEIAKETQLSRSTVKRRLSILDLETPSRDHLKAASNYRLDRYTRQVMRAIDEFGIEPGDVAKLASTGTQLERRRAQLNGLDEPTASRIAVSNVPAEEPSKPPWLSDALAEWKASDLYRQDLEAAGRDDGPGAEL